MEWIFLIILLNSVHVKFDCWSQDALASHNSTEPVDFGPNHIIDDNDNDSSQKVKDATNICQLLKIKSLKIEPASMIKSIT